MIACRSETVITFQRTAENVPNANMAQTRVAEEVNPIRRDHEVYRTTNGLFGGVPKEPLRPGIPSFDYSIERSPHNRIIGRLDDGRKKASRCKLICYLLLQMPSFGNILENEHVPKYLAIS